jgi:outer membrane protein W
MKMKHWLTIFFLIGFTSAWAQEKYFYLALDVNKPVSNTSWIGSTSNSGLKIGYRFFINDQISVGVDLASQTFDQYNPTETVVNPNGAVTTDYFKYIYSYSGVVSGQYYFKIDDKKRFFPYAGLGLGANNNEYIVYYNIYSDAERKWGFLARPEAGILFKFGSRRSVGAMAAIHYDYSTNRSDMFDYNNFSTVGFQVGIMFMEL